MYHMQSAEITAANSHLSNVRSRMQWYADHLLAKLGMASDKKEYGDHTFKTHLKTWQKF